MAEYSSVNTSASGVIRVIEWEPPICYFSKDLTPNFLILLRSFLDTKGPAM